MHIGSEAAAQGKQIEVVHPVELLHRAVFGGIGMRPASGPAKQ
jgi:hypothetical protein